MSDRYETRESPVTGYIWVTWDKQNNWFVYGATNKDDVDAYTAKLNTVSTIPEETK